MSIYDAYVYMYTHERTFPLNWLQSLREDSIIFLEPIQTIYSNNTDK